MTDYPDDEIIMVPVPKSRLMAFYAAVLGNPRTEQGAPVQDEETVQVPKQGLLTESMVGRLESELDIPAVKSLITHLAEQAPKWLTFKESVEVAGIESAALRAQLGSLTKITKRLFDYACWPMEVRYNESGEAIYRMDPTIARWWLDATSEDV